MYNQCNCEHTDHFDDEFGPQTAHDYRFVPASPSWTGMYVGPICTECGMGHMSDYLVKHGPEMEDGRFIQNTWFTYQDVMPLTKREMEILFDEE